MKAVKDWFGKDRRINITVCWMDDGISLAEWEQGPVRSSTIKNSLILEARSVSGRTYREALLEMMGDGRKPDVDVLWVVLSESFPHAGTEAECVPLLPGWVTRCWDALDWKEIPETILSGRKSLEKAIETWPELARSGTGLCLRIRERLLFLGKGNDICYHRLSRKGVARADDRDYISREWILQTRLLFRNRTGTVLRKVIIPDGRECHFSWENEQSLEIISGLHPPDWTRLEGVGLDDGLHFLHASAYYGSRESTSRLCLPSLEKRRRSRAWDRRLRIASCLLLGGWGFLLMGACRHNVTASPDQAFADKMTAYQAEFQGYDQRWRRHVASEETRKAPYRLIGRIAQSKPDSVEVKRMHLARTVKAGPRNFTLKLEGAWNGQEPDAGFRRWLDGLGPAVGLQEIENLNLSRNSESIQFSLQGKIAEGKE